MAMIEALKGTLMFLGVLSLIVFVVIGAEVAFMLLVQIVDEIRDRRKKARLWED